MNYYRKYILQELTNRQKVTAYGSLVPIVGNLVGLLGYDLYTKFDPAERIADLERELTRAKRQGNEKKINRLKKILNDYLLKIEKKAKKEARKDRTIKYRYIAKQLDNLRSENNLNEGMGDALNAFMHSGKYTKLKSITTGLAVFHSIGSTNAAAAVGAVLGTSAPLLAIGLAYGLGIGYVAGKASERNLADIDPSGKLTFYNKQFEKEAKRGNYKKAMNIIDNAIYELRRIQLNYKRSDEYKELEQKLKPQIERARRSLKMKVEK